MKVIVFGLLLFCFHETLAQDILDEMANTVCSCLENKNLDEMERSKIKMEAGLCILEYYQNNQEVLNEYFGIDEFNGETGRMIGEKLGFKMAAVCPGLIMKLAGTQEPEESSGYVLEGRITKLEEGDFISYQLKATDGKTYKVLWYKNFQGSEDLIADPKKLVGKKVSVTVQEVECYIPKARGYYSIKEIQEIKLL